MPGDLEEKHTLRYEAGSEFVMTIDETDKGGAKVRFHAKGVEDEIVVPAKMIEKFAKGFDLAAKLLYLIMLVRNGGIDAKESG